MLSKSQQSIIRRMIRERQRAISALEQAIAGPAARKRAPAPKRKGLPRNRLTSALDRLEAQSKQAGSKRALEGS